MGFRLYVNKIYESPKLFGYVDEPPSYKILAKFAKEGKIKTLDRDDLDVFEDYGNMCVAPSTEKYNIPAEEFRIFMEQYIKDLENKLGDVSNYRFVLDMKNIMSTDDWKIIEWG